MNSAKESVISKEEIASSFKKLQDDICKALATADGTGSFKEDLWEREGGGGGRTRTFENGNIIAKGGVNFSAVYGSTPEKILKKLQLKKADFFATGVSIVIHPKNPWVPIIHMNIRYFEMTNGAWWFGGGIDLTPHYVNKDDATYFHRKLKAVCDKHGNDLYVKYKKWADDYFYIKHRNETRGIGGIFFDRLNTDTTSKNKAELFSFVSDVGESFAPLYTYFMNKNHQLAYSDTELKWQNIRRSRYVEFNLVYDAGTKFGLDTNGRTESILMSMPPVAQWEYNHTPEPNSKEAVTLQLLKKDIDWLA